MENQKFDKQKLIIYWQESSDSDFETMLAMFEAKRYNWSLFVGHLMIEKLLKAYFVKMNEDFPPYIHNLLRLAEKSGLVMTEQDKTNLAYVTAFNINTRYDDYKMSFQKKCTPEFTQFWINKLKEMRIWIKGLINS